MTTLQKYSPNFPWSRDDPSRSSLPDREHCSRLQSDIPRYLRVSALTPVPSYIEGREHSIRAFTLLELLLSILIMAVVTTITYMAFSTMTTAWKRGNALSEDLGHGDFVVEQLVMALRSAYYPDGPQPSAIYGFRMEDHGDGLGANDRISWVKLGQSLVGSDTALGGTPHRTVFTVQQNAKGQPSAAVQAWGLLDETPDFNPELQPYTFLSDRVIGFDCKCSDKAVTADTKWLDEWDDTNRLPRVVQLTLYMKPLSEKKEPVEIRRIVEIPVAPLSWGGTP